MTRWLPKLLLGAWLLGFAVPASAEHQSHYALVQHALDGYVLPKVETFRGKSEALARTVSGFCAAPAEAERQRVKTAFGDALRAWAEAEIVRIGPVTKDGRGQRIAFWPDIRGAVARQLRQAIAKADPSIASAKLIAGGSAAVQGFPALEMLLADTTVPIGAPGAEGAFRCKAATAIAANIAAVAGDVAGGWTRDGGWRDKMLRPGSDNPTYPSADAAAADVLRSITTSLQLIVAAELNPLAEGGKKAKSFPQPYKQLGLSRDYLLTGVRACRMLYDAARLDGYLDPDGVTAKTLRALFDDTLASIGAETWMAEGRDEAANQEQARVAASKLSDARRLIAKDVANAAEITLGFNELDGD